MLVYMCKVKKGGKPMLKALSYFIACILISTKIAKEVESTIGLHLDNELKKIKIKQEQEKDGNDKEDST